jgi:hypothetical protein
MMSGAIDAAGSLAEPIHDGAAAAFGRSTYLFGDGSPSTVATVQSLPSPAVPPTAVVADAGLLEAFGGEIQAAGGTVAATNDIQMIDPATHKVRVVGHLPQPLYGASAFVIAGTVYVAGGQVPGWITLTQIDAFVPATGKVLNAGLLPQDDAFAGYATLPTAHGAIGYMVGGEVASQSGTDQAGVASGSLDSVISLRLSSYGGSAAGSMHMCQAYR